MIKVEKPDKYASYCNSCFDPALITIKITPAGYNESRSIGLCSVCALELEQGLRVSQKPEAVE